VVFKLPFAFFEKIENLRICNAFVTRGVI
jgi:hypothetical protein